MATKKAVHSVGKRKSSIARIWMRPGTGVITVNGRPIVDYFLRATSRMLIDQPLSLTGNLGKFDIQVNAIGGGLSGQSGAIRHAIARALAEMEPEQRGVLKANGMITRDARTKERKLYGRKGARARYQFSKR